jgi:hypothetical protein
VTEELERLGNDLAMAIAQSSGISDNLSGIVNYVIDEIEYRYGIDDELGTLYHDFNIISDRKLLRTAIDYDYNGADLFIGSRIKGESVNASVYLESGRNLKIEFIITLLYGSNLDSEVEIYVLIKNENIRRGDVHLSGEIYSESFSESDLNGALLWLTLQR